MTRENDETHENPGARTDAELDGRATVGGQEKGDGADGPRPRVEWTDDGTPRPEDTPASVADPRGDEDEDEQGSDSDRSE